MKYKNEKILVNELAMSRVCADDRLTEFWGRALSAKDLVICYILGWAGEGESNENVWYLNAEVGGFSGPIYVDNKLRVIKWDAEVQGLLMRCQLACLDSVLGDSKREIDLRAMLTLVHYVLMGWATFVDRGDHLYFIGLEKNVSDLRGSDRVLEILDAGVADGAFVRVVGLDGKTYLQATPKSLLHDLSDARAAELSLLEICRELAFRGLMRRTLTDGHYEWNPTPKGLSEGLGANNIGILEVLERLGLASALNDVRERNKIKRVCPTLH